MHHFNIRVELLHGATAQDYQHLHERMRINGFISVIAGRNGARAHLPPAEYVHVSASATQTVRDLAVKVVGTGLRGGVGLRVYVVQFVDWASHGLEAA